MSREEQHGYTRQNLNDCLPTENKTVYYFVIKPGGEVRKSRGGEGERKRGKDTVTERVRKKKDVKKAISELVQKQLLY